MTTKLPPPFRHSPGSPEYAGLPADDPKVQPDPDAPDDYAPLPDAMQQQDPVTETFQVLRAHFWGRPGVLTHGDSPVYYLDEEERQRICRPDAYVAFGVNPIAIRRRNGYFIREVGKAPDFALEIASVSTYENDLGPKRDLYARLGIGEYWRFDVTGGEYYPQPLAGETLVDGEYHPIEINREADGIIRGHSPILSLDLCWFEGDLYFFDPATHTWLENVLRAKARADSQAARADSQAARADSQTARADSQAARAAAAERELEEVRAQLRRLQGD